MKEVSVRSDYLIYTLSRGASLAMYEAAFIFESTALICEIDECLLIFKVLWGKQSMI